MYKYARLDVKQYKHPYMEMISSIKFSMRPALNEAADAFTLSLPYPHGKSPNKHFLTEVPRAAICPFYNFRLGQPRKVL